MDIESSFIVGHDSLLLVLETHLALNAVQGLTFEDIGFDTKIFVGGALSNLCNSTSTRK